jgi:NtrC-family two-component system sensor histidine kinase KinB
MKLRTKILGGYGLVLTPIVIVWTWAIINIAHLGSASDAILRENYRSILAAENMIDVIERQDSNILLFIMGDEGGLAQFRQHEIEFLEWLGRAKNNITLEGEAEALETIEQQYLAYLETVGQLREIQLTQDQGAVNHYQEVVLPIFQKVRDACIALRDMNQNAMLATSGEAQVIANRAIWSTAVIGAVVVGLGMVFSLLLSNILTRPLQAMTQAAEKIAGGNYEVALQVKSNDELGILAQELTEMGQELKTFHELNINQVLTEKQRSEAIIRSINDGIVVVNDDFEIIAINPMAAQIFNTTPDQARGKHFLDIVGDRTLYESIKTVPKNGKSPLATTKSATTVLALEGEAQTQYYNVATTLVKTEKNHPLGVVLLLQDVTKLKELDRLKSEFIMTASHELRTPLTGIAMSIGLLMENAHQKLSAEEQELLQAAHEDIQRLRALVNDLLDLSKIETGRVEMDFEAVDVMLLAERAVSTLAQQAKQANIDLAYQIPEDLPQVKADPNKITWVLTNLIANAIRYTDAGGCICVSAQKVRGFVHISVADNGAGIPLEYQSKIFDKFVQLKTDKVVGGSGLGLAICKEIVKAHGGTIWVDSAPGQGSTFTFTLPVA